MNTVKAKFTPYEVDKIINLVWHILFTCLTINDIESRKQSETGNKPTAFFEFNGHVNSVEVQIYRDGWTDDDSKRVKTFSKTVWMDADNGFDVVSGQLEELHRDLCRFLPEELEAERAMYEEIEAKKAELNNLEFEFERRFPKNVNDAKFNG